MTGADIHAEVDLMQFADSIPAIGRIVTDPAGRIRAERTPERVGCVPLNAVIVDARCVGSLRNQHIPLAVSHSGPAARVEPEPSTGTERVVGGRPTDDRTSHGPGRHYGVPAGPAGARHHGPS